MNRNHRTSTITARRVSMNGFFAGCTTLCQVASKRQDVCGCNTSQSWGKRCYLWILPNQLAKMFFLALCTFCLTYCHSGSLCAVLQD